MCCGKRKNRHDPSGGGENILSEGMVVVINPGGEVHSCEPIDGEACSYWMIHLDIDWCFNIQKEMFGDLDSYLKLNIYSIDKTEIFDSFCNILRNLHDADSREEIEAELTETISVLFGNYCEKEQVDISNVIVREAAEYLTMNMFETISLDSLADRFRQNRFHLLRSFKSVYGVPPMAFQMNLRIEHAKGMLRHGGVSIADVAQETGFTDQSHFHRIFKKYVAATPPGEYIK